MLGNLPPNGRFSRQILESALNLPAENGRWKIYLPFRLFETGVKWKILGEMADLRIYILYETQLEVGRLRAWGPFFPELKGKLESGLSNNCTRLSSVRKDNQLPGTYTYR